MMETVQGLSLRARANAPRFDSLAVSLPRSISEQLSGLPLIQLSTHYLRAPHPFLILGLKLSNLPPLCLSACLLTHATPPTLPS